MVLNAFAGIGGPPKTPKVVQQQQPIKIPTSTPTSSYYDMMGAQSAQAMGAPAPAPTSSGSSSSGVPQLNLHADTNQALEALAGQYSQQLSDIKGNTGHIMDTLGTKMRDSREGGRRALQEDSTLAGRASDPGLANYDSQTQGMVDQTLADVALGQQDRLTSALQGGVSVMGAPASMAMNEKNLQVQAYNAQNAAAQNSFDRFLALLNATRTSPLNQPQTIYTGY